MLTNYPLFTWAAFNVLLCDVAYSGEEIPTETNRGMDWIGDFAAKTLEVAQKFD
jgi:hypothetical protein